MAWYGPNQCDDQCCYPPTPCEPPRVTCKRYATGGTFGEGYLTYDISLADTAWVHESCEGYGGEIGTDYPITLSSGAASGTFSDVHTNCSYTIHAVNSCGKRFCIDECTPPLCSLKVYRRIKEGTIFEYDAVIVEWEYNWKATPHSPFAVDEIVSATINGDDVLDLPTQGSGTITYTDPDDLPDEFVMLVENDCGLVSECVFTVPCCWKVKQLRVTLSLSDVSANCTRTDIGLINNIQYHSVTDEFSTTGLAALNGTYLIDCYWFSCQPKPEDQVVGTFTVRQRGVLDTTDFRFFPNIVELREYIVEWTVRVKLTASGVGEGATALLMFDVPNGEFYNKQVRNGVTLYDGQRCVCVVAGPAYVPPCPTTCIGGGVNQVPAWLGSSNELNVICGTSSTHPYTIPHRHPLAGVITLGGTAGACDPAFPATQPATIQSTTITLAATTEFI